MKRHLPADRYYRSLMRSILSILGIVFFLPMAVVGGVIYYHFHTAYKEEVYAHLEDTVHDGKQQIDGFLQDRLDLLVFLVESADFKRLRDAARLQEVLDTLNTVYGPTFSDLSIIDDEDRPVAHTDSFPADNFEDAETDWQAKSGCDSDAINRRVEEIDGIDYPMLVICIHRFGRPWLVAAAMESNVIAELLQGVRKRRSGEVYVVSHAGRRQTWWPDGIDPHEAVIKEILDAGGADQRDHRILRRKDGTGREQLYGAASLETTDWLLVYRMPVSDAFSGLRKVQFYTVGVVLIISLGLAFEAFRLTRKMILRMEQSDRERESRNEQMLQTGKLAAIGELAAGVAHEINNPVAIMVEEAGWIEDLLDEPEFRKAANATEMRRAAGQIRSQGKRCKEITQQLLSFARKTDASVQEVDLHALIDDLIAVTQKRADLRQVGIRIDLQSDLPLLRVSQTELQQVLLNLINNALDAMEEKGGTLSISARQEEDRILITVSDTGPGIPAEAVPRIFDPFFTTKPVGRGTGLGLSICYGIIESLGGGIQVESRPNQGTAFHIHLPRAQTPTL